MNYTEWRQGVEQRLSKATPGPWRHGHHSFYDFVATQIDPDDGSSELISENNCPEDADLIARAPDDLSQALKFLAEKDEQIRKLKEALEKIKSHGCCVMHSGRGCPGCTAHDALKDCEGLE